MKGVAPPALLEKRLGSQEVFKGAFLHAFRDQVLLPSGASACREYVVHPGAVMVVPLHENSRGEVELVLERQFRYPVGDCLFNGIHRHLVCTRTVAWTSKFG